MSQRLLALFLAVALTSLVTWEAVEAQTGASEGRGTALVLQPGDILTVRVWPTTDLSGEFVIEETGMIYLPQIEAVRAGGMTIDDLRAELRRRYGETIRNPVVSVMPMYRVSITGAVQRPGIHTITPTHEILDVVGMAGGLRVEADAENVRIVRAGGVIEFNALRALETGEGMDAVRLRSGDHIVVPAQRPSRFTVRNVFEGVRTISTLVLLWDRVFR